LGIFTEYVWQIFKIFDSQASGLLCKIVGARELHRVAWLSKDLILISKFLGKIPESQQSQQGSQPGAWQSMQAAGMAANT
jgi:hypothetical protein